MPAAQGATASAARSTAARGRLLVVPLHLHQQHGFGAGLADELEEGAVQQLDGRRVVREQRGDGIAQGVERPERDAEACPRRGQRVEPPLGRGDEAERALGADQKVEQVARLEPRVQRVARGVLPGTGKARAHQLGGGADGGRRIGLEPLDAPACAAPAAGRGGAR